MSEVFIHATMTVRFGAEQLLNDSMGQLLPRVAKLGWKLDACYRFVTGPTRIILNVWKIPDANAFTLLPEQIAGDPELAAIMGKIHSCLEANELTLMTPHTYPKPVKSPRQPARSR